MQGSGIRYLVMDSGWYKEEDKNWWDTIGDWNVSKQLFPEGLKPVNDMIKSYGLIPGIWFEMENVVKTARAEAKTVRISARKVRLVIDLVRGKNIGDAFSILHLTPNGASVAVAKVIKSAVANAEHNYEMDTNKLYVKEIYANEGITMKRYLPRAKGSASTLFKRTSNIVVVVAERN